MLLYRSKNNHTSELNLRLNSNDISVFELKFLCLYYLNLKLNWDTYINVIGKEISRAVTIINIKKMKCFSRTQFSIPCITLWYCHILITVYFRRD